MNADQAKDLIERLLVEQQVRLTPINPRDNMCSPGRQEHYYSVGRDALWNVVQSMQAAGLPKANAILDFPSGFGRVTRYLRSAFLESEIYVGDIWEAAVDDCALTYRAHKIAVTNDLREISAPNFDVIFCGSLITHFPEEKGRELLDFFVSHLNPGGIAIVSCSGRKNLAHENLHFNERVFGTRENLERLTRDYYEGRYAYADYPGQPGYGRAFVPVGWFQDYVGNNLDLAIVRFAERAWDDNQDIVTIKKFG